MNDAGDSLEELAAVRHLLELGYEDPLEKVARNQLELRAQNSQLKQAQAWLEAGQLKAAVDLLEQIVRETPDRVAPRRLLARAYFRGGRLSEAGVLLRGLELDGVEEAELALLRAAIALQRRCFGEALDQSQYALCLRQPLPAAELVLGEVHFRRGDLAAAEAAYQRASQHQPARAAALTGSAAIAQRRGDDERAIEQLLAALELDMRHWAAHYRLGLALMRLGRRAEARAALTACLDLNADLAGPWRFLARLGLEDSDLAAAAQCRARGRETIARRHAARTQRGAP